MMSLALSLFPGVGLLDRAFELEGFCVVRGPDVLWGGDIRRFHPPAGRFDGVIGGPPCQAFSRMRHVNPKCGQKHGNLIPEFERVVAEAEPEWFLMENVPNAPEPAVSGYSVSPRILNNRWLGEVQNRVRRFSFGVRGGPAVPLLPQVAVFEAPEFAHAALGTDRAVPVALVRDGRGGHRRTAPPTVTGGHGSPFSHSRGNVTLGDMCELQGLPRDFLDEAPFTAHGKRKALGNGVPIPMGRAIARAVREALMLEEAAP
jgi:DNA (cytosine-5)-methyltransferase 1